VHIFSLISQKGGAGKSTLARQLAVLAGEAGTSVLIDRDPQATSTKWWQRRQALQPTPERPDLLDLDGMDLVAAAGALHKQRGGAVFVDTRPAVTEPEAEAARVADLVIVPVRPSPDDLNRVYFETCGSRGCRDGDGVPYAEAVLRDFIRHNVTS
jgi:chromosome partitioning protein